jgi:hypothetical protein
MSWQASNPGKCCACDGTMTPSDPMSPPIHEDCLEIMWDPEEGDEQPSMPAATGSGDSWQDQHPGICAVCYDPFSNSPALDAPPIHNECHDVIMGED